MNHTGVEQRYLEIILSAIQVCTSYKPKMGHGAQAGLSLGDFQTLYSADPFYSWFGLDNPLMYAAHKAAGGMTSVYRQIGIGCERVFRAILQDHLGLSADDACWSYTVTGANAKERKLTLDGRIPLARIKDKAKRARVAQWIREACDDLAVAPKIARSLQGVVFEVRQGYKSKDSKRQNADIANAATAYTKAYLPCALILSTQIDTDIVIRYKAEKWVILTGLVGTAGPHASSFAFLRDVVGYNFADFLTRNAPTLRAAVAEVLEALLRAE